MPKMKMRLPWSSKCGLPSSAHVPSTKKCSIWSSAFVSRGRPKKKCENYPNNTHNSNQYFKIIPLRRSAKHKRSFGKKFLPSPKQSTENLLRKVATSIASKNSINTFKAFCASWLTAPWLSAWRKIESMWLCSGWRIIDKEDNDYFNVCHI